MFSLQRWMDEERFGDSEDHWRGTPVDLFSSSPRLLDRSTTVHHHRQVERLAANERALCYVVLFKSATGREPVMSNTQGTIKADYFPFKPCLCLQVWLNSTSPSTSSCITLLYCCLSSEESSSLPSVICAGGFAVAGYTNKQFLLVNVLTNTIVTSVTLLRRYSLFCLPVLCGETWKQVNGVA